MRTCLNGCAYGRGCAWAWFGFGCRNGVTPCEVLCGDRPGTDPHVCSHMVTPNYVYTPAAAHRIHAKPFYTHTHNSVLSTPTVPHPQQRPPRHVLDSAAHSTHTCYRAAVLDHNNGRETGCIAAHGCCKQAAHSNCSGRGPSTDVLQPAAGGCTGRGAALVVGCRRAVCAGSPGCTRLSRCRQQMCWASDVIYAHVLPRRSAASVLLTLRQAARHHRRRGRRGTRRCVGQLHGGAVVLRTQPCLVICACACCVACAKPTQLRQFLTCFARTVCRRRAGRSVSGGDQQRFASI